MSRHADLLIVGAGPAGMSAATMARRFGLDVLVVDEQPAPGGQIWRGIEAVAGTARAEVLGPAYKEGQEVVRQFRASGARYEPETQVWQIEPGPRTFMTRAGRAGSVDASALLLATGAQERPIPFHGWTLPGVMTVGAGQILLKASGQIPDMPVWIAGSGPLTLLYAVQLLKAGGRIAGILDTTPAGRAVRTLPQLVQAISGAAGEVLKGLGWLSQLRRQVRYVRHVTDIEAHGEEALQRIVYRTAKGVSHTVEAQILLVHEGVVPTIHPTLALGCKHIWNADQDSYAPELDPWGETSEPSVFVAGDGAGIGGAKAAVLRGQIAALGVALRFGRISAADARSWARPIRIDLARALAPRAFLDRFYRPRPAIFAPADGTLVCRCEEVTAGAVRAMTRTGKPDPNRVKTFIRAGMGPCQGRQCSYSVASILAAASSSTVPDIGLYRVRPPFKPLTLGELSALDSLEDAS